jgi:hypothetical protein
VADFDELVTEAATAPFSGWDLSWLDGRSGSEPLPWDHGARVAALAGGARTMLDMGTGGGEVLARLPARANRTVATRGMAAQRHGQYPRPASPGITGASVGDDHGDRAVFLRKRHDGWHKPEPRRAKDMSFPRFWTT